jgi:hypothetical protein
MRFRAGGHADIAPCLQLLREDGGLRCSEESWRAMPGAWERLLDREMGVFLVWEDLSGTAPVLAAFGVSVFIARALLDAYCASPAPYFAELFYQWARTASWPVVDGDDVRQSRGAGLSLDLVVLHFCLRHRSLDHPVTQRYLPVGASAWYYAHAGYKLDSLWFEVFGAEHARFLEHGGYALRHDFSAWSREHATPEALSPFMYGMAREEVRRGAMDQGSLAMFEPPAPCFGFSPAEQSLLRRSLLGASDRELAGQLHVAQDTVKKLWNGIYQRVQRANPHVLGVRDIDPMTRGTEKRRHLIEYLRHHMEELRPRARP